MTQPERKFSNHDEAIEATAAAWLAERDGGLTPEAAEEFACWRQADPRHEAAVVLLEGTWSKLRQLQSFRPEARVHPDHDLLARPAVRRAPHFPSLAATAALAASLALAAAWWWLRPARPSAGATRPAPAVLATAANGYTSTTLPDGSVLELNASSEVSVHFTKAERRLHLVRGEAHFTVAKNKARPFWVEAGTVSVRAVGTEFNVSLRPDSVDVLVTEGRVQVDRSPGLAAAGQPLQTVAVVSAGQETVVALQGGPDRPAVATVNAAVIREELAWQGPRLEFSDTPLAEVASQFNRYNAVQLELSDPVLGAQPVGGSFKAENVDAFVRLLTSGKDVAADRPDAGHIVLRRTR